MMVRLTSVNIFLTVSVIFLTQNLLTLSLKQSKKSSKNFKNSTSEIVNDVRLISTGDGGFRVQFRVFGSSYRLVVAPVEASIQMWAMDDPDTVTLNDVDVGSLYQDTDKDASLVIEEKGGLYSIAGNAGEVVLQPAGGRGRTCGGCLKTTKHVVTRRQEGGGGAEESDYGFVENHPEQEQRRGRAMGNEGRFARQGRRTSRKQPSKIYPEILVVADYEFYKKHRKDLAATKKYILSFWNGVNMRFNDIKSPRVELTIAGIIVATTPTATPYLHRNTISGIYLDAPNALDATGKFYYKPPPSLPVHDMVVVITGLDMCRAKGSKRCDRATAGYAYVGGACVANRRLKKINSVAIVEDSGGYSGVIVAAHEVAHVLGAVHDGTPPPSYLGGPGATACPWSHGFLMSDLRRTTNGLHWSSCTKKCLAYFLSTTTASCMHNAPRHNNHALPGPRNLPGHTLSLDQQCYKDRGTRACYSDSRVCTQLFCYSARSKTCYAYRPAAEGSKCGVGKSCSDGKCVSVTGLKHQKPSYKSKSNSKYSKSSRKSSKSSKSSKSTSSIKKTTLKKSLKIPTIKMKPFITYPIKTTWASSKTKRPKRFVLHRTGKTATTADTAKGGKSGGSKKNTRDDNNIKDKHCDDNDDNDDKCVDTISSGGSKMGCDNFYKNYAFKYCSSITIKKKCCISHKKYC